MTTTPIFVITAKDQSGAFTVEGAYLSAEDAQIAVASLIANANEDIGEDGLDFDDETPVSTRPAGFHIESDNEEGVETIELYKNTAQPGTFYGESVLSELLATFTISESFLEGDDEEEDEGETYEPSDSEGEEED